MTPQQVFDKVAAHLLAQGAKSRRQHRHILDAAASTICAYRGDGGRKCAIGALITDEAYTPELEGARVSSRKVRSALIQSGAPVDGCALLLRDLQRVHDHVEYDDWYWSLAEVALKHGLNTDNLESV